VALGARTAQHEARDVMMLVRALAIAFVACTPASAQDSTVAMPAVLVARAPVPFGAGERADYQVKYGPFSVGRGSMQVVGIDTVRGRETWHTQFHVRGGIPGFRVNNVMDSWIDTQTLSSLRHWQDFDEGPNERERRFEIFPDSIFVQQGRQPERTVPLPLDDGSFLYFLRTLSLEIGKEYSYNRYFRPDRNPVVFKVLRKERIKVPAGEFSTVVIRPVIKARGVFAENGRAEVWLTDDDRRVMVQMKTQLSFGSLSLHLRSYAPATAPSDSALARR
jgi:hypothetical protein